LRNGGVGERMILNWFLEKYGVKMRNGIGHDLMIVFCEHSDKSQAYT